MKPKGFAVLNLLLIVLVALAVGCGGNSKGTFSTPTVVPSPSPSQPPVTIPNPLIYYTFDSDANDASGNGLNGMLVGSAAITTTAGAPVGTGCVDLTANTDLTVDGAAYVTLPAFSLDGSYTIAWWVKLTSYGTGWPRLINFNGTNGLAYIACDNNTTDPNGPFVTFVQTLNNNWFAGFGNRAGTNTVFPLNTWVHVVFTYDNTASAGSSLAMYVNGEKIGIYDNFSIAALGTLTSNYIGYSSFDPEIQGYIDDFQVYNTALSAAQAGALYSGNYSFIPHN